MANYRYDTLEENIKNHLSVLTADGYEVNESPETSIEKNDAFSKPRITIMYNESEYSDQIIKGYPKNLSSDASAQFEFAEIIIVIQSRVLRGPNGIHTIKEKAESLLFGFKPGRQWEKIFIKSYKFAEQKEGVWSYYLTIVTGRILIQSFDDIIITNTDNTQALNGPTLREIIGQQDGEEVFHTGPVVTP